MRVVTVRLSESMLSEIDALARELGLDRSEVIRLLISRSLREERLRRAIEMYVRDEVTLEKAAELAGVPLIDFIAELRRRGVPHKEDESPEVVLRMLRSLGLL